MSKIRVYELARDMNIESKLLMNTLKSIGISVQTHQSTLTDDQIERLKKALSGETAAAKPATATAAKADSGSVRVIRRRRPGAEDEGPAPTAPSDVAAPPSDTAVPQQASEASAARPAEITTESAPESAIASDQLASPVEKPTLEAPKMEAPRPVIPPPRAPITKRSAALASGEAGAKIVRKATPEEVEQNKAEREQLFKRRTRREDSKGTKYTGIGSGTPEEVAFRGTQAEQMRTGIDPSVIESAEDGTSRRGKDKRRSATDEFSTTEETSPNLKKPIKGKRDDAINARLLLRQIDEEPTDDIDLFSFGAQPAESEDAAISRQKKAIYTPGAMAKKRDLKRRKDLKKTEITTARASYRVVEMGNEITIGELSRQLKVKAGEIIKKLMDQGMMVTINQNIDVDTATLLASEYAYEVKSTVKSIEDVLGRKLSKEREEQFDIARPPIVTVMGHVDHGKTSILDAIRKTEVAAGEAGGITQHIGAYSVTHNGKKIAFLDTPGHEAFSAMRARGANLTDIVVLVVAADDGVMPQTIEAINHAKDAGVPIVVAVNKIDKPNINLDRVYTELTAHGIQSEEWGGETQFVKVSALKGIGIDELLEAILLQAEILDLKTSRSMLAEGAIVEAHLDVGRGPVATVMVQHGTLRIGDYLVAGRVFGKVRAMEDHFGNSVKEANASTPVIVLGLGGVPLAGDSVIYAKDEKTAREVVAFREAQLSQVGVKSSAQTLEDLLSKVQTGVVPEFSVIVKADTQGSLEAICDAIHKLSGEKVKNRIIHRAVGGISESDLTLASASGAVIVAFNVRAARGLDDLADRQGIIIKYFSIIYDLVDAIKALMAGKLPPIIEEVTVGRAEVRQPISVPKFGTIAGSAVLDGKISRNSLLRLIRDDIVIFQGKVSSLRRFKEDVREVKSGYECGIGVENYNDIKVGDVIEAFEIKETQATL